MDGAEAEKRAKNIQKKLGQIEKLKEKDDSELDADARQKIATESELRSELATLRGGSGDAPAPAAKSAKQAAPKAPAPPPEEVKKLKKAPAPVAEEPEVVAEAPTLDAQPSGPSLDQEKRIKNLKKKLQQIDTMRKKGGALDAEALEKVNSEPEIRKEIAALERGEEYVPPAKSAKVEEVKEVEATVAREDPLADARAAALQPAVTDLGLLLDDATEKGFKSLQKTLRDIDILRQKDKLDKLQENKLTKEGGIIEELDAIRAKANVALEARRNNYSPPVRKQEEENEAEGEDEKPKESKKKKEKPAEEEEEVKEKIRTFDSAGLKSNRQQNAAETVGMTKAAKEKLHEVTVDASRACWPEVKEVIESGDHGNDKGRQKKGILVENSEMISPYNVFDSTLLRCGFLTRVELKLAPGVLMQEAFQLYFPGSLCDNLLELILKGNKMTRIPPGLRDLKRVRSIDFSHNALEELPEADTWGNISGSLELLDLSFNKIGSVENLHPLTKLSSLKLDGNKINSLDGVSWAKLKQLSTLTVVGNQVKEIPSEVAEVAESLMHFDLSENGITECPVEIVELKKLKTFSLTGNPIKDQKVVNNLAKGSNGLKDLKAYLSKNATKGRKK